MLVKFKSQNAADVLMYEDNARPILELLHKDATRGVITAAEAAGAVATLEAAVAESKRQAASEPRQDYGSTHDITGEPSEPGASPGIGFATRVHPLLEMLRAAQADKRDVMWGV
ncbi:hypothetical protein BH11PSE11_BH11PSE11_09610 [soil metagenome]